MVSKKRKARAENDIRAVVPRVFRVAPELTVTGLYSDAALLICIVSTFVLQAPAGIRKEQ